MASSRRVVAAVLAGNGMIAATGNQALMLRGMGASTPNAYRKGFDHG